MFLYVLKLECECWYVGISQTPMKRALEHLNGNGAAWTRKHRPLKPLKDNIVITDIGNLTVSNAELKEDMVTEGMQKKFGLNKVRGGYTIQCQNMRKRPNRAKAKWMYTRFKAGWRD